MQEEVEKERDAGMNLLNSIINETFCRHNDLTEEEYKAKLNATESKLTEDELVKTGLYNVMVELTKQVFKLQQKTNIMVGTLQIALKEKQNGRN